MGGCATRNNSVIIIIILLFMTVNDYSYDVMIVLNVCIERTGFELQLFILKLTFWNEGKLTGALHDS